MRTVEAPEFVNGHPVPRDSDHLIALRRWSTLQVVDLRARSSPRDGSGFPAAGSCAIVRGSRKKRSASRGSGRCACKVVARLAPERPPSVEPLEPPAPTRRALPDPSYCLVIRRSRQKHADSSGRLQQCCESGPLVSSRYLVHPCESRLQSCPALRPDFGALARGPLGPAPSLCTLRFLQWLHCKPTSPSTMNADRTGGWEAKPLQMRSRLIH